jgi:hypothetical protein
MLTKLYIESYPKILYRCTCWVHHAVRRRVCEAPVTRNRVSHDYTAIDYNYNFKASQIDHWCLFCKYLWLITTNEKVSR